MTVPMMWGILAVIGKSVADTFFVARLGTDPLSAIAFTFPVSLTVGSLAIGLGAGAASVVARAIGQGDEHLVRRRATDALILGFLMVLVTAVAGIMTIEPLFRLLGAEGQVLELIKGFMRIGYLGLPLLVVPMVGNSLIRAVGDGKIPGLIMMGSAAVNITLDPILIFGLLGAPELGMVGAAWASVIGNGLTLLASLAVLHFRERMLEGGFPGLSTLWQSWRAVLHVGLPAAAANMINPIGVGFVTRMLSEHGKEAVAAFGVATRVEAVAVVGLFALSATIGPIVGQNWGARQGDRVRLAIVRSYQYCLKYGLVMAAVVALLATVIVDWFSDSPTVRELSLAYLWIVPVTLFGYGINITGAAALNAVGKPLVATFLTFARMGLVYIPLAGYLGGIYGPAGVFVAAGIANLVAAWMTWWLTRQVLMSVALKWQPQGP
jgi:putative MATE family efflux protein